MRLIQDSGAYFLEDNGQRLALSAREIHLFKQMKPMGRKLILRKRAVDKILSHPGDPEIQLIRFLSKLPIKEWAFTVPDLV